MGTLCGTIVHKENRMFEFKLIHSMNVQNHFPRGASGVRLRLKSPTFSLKWVLQSPTKVHLFILVNL